VAVLIYSTAAKGLVTSSMMAARLCPLLRGVLDRTASLILRKLFLRASACFLEVYPESQILSRNRHVYQSGLFPDGG